MSDFSMQFAVPIDTSEVNWNILELTEACSNMNGHIFHISKNITISETPDFLNDEKLGQLHHESFLSLVDLKQIKILEAIEELRQEIEHSFSVEITKFENRERVIQIVKTPLCFIDLAPGDTSISFKVFTERRLGTIDEIEKDESNVHST